MAADALLTELLDSLCHDLGKYLNMPLRMLPRDAAANEVRAAVYDALFRTQRSASGARTAQEIYQAARAQLIEAHADAERLGELDEAVAQALSWRDMLDEAETPIERSSVELDFGHVRELLETWRDEASID